MKKDYVEKYGTRLFNTFKIIIISMILWSITWSMISGGFFSRDTLESFYSFFGFGLIDTGYVVGWILILVFFIGIEKNIQKKVRLGQLIEKE